MEDGYRTSGFGGSKQSAYGDTTSGLTSVLQLVDRTPTVNFFPNSTGADPRPCDRHDRGTGKRGRESPL